MRTLASLALCLAVRCGPATQGPLALSSSSEAPASTPATSERRAARPAAVAREVAATTTRRRGDCDDARSGPLVAGPSEVARRRARGDMDIETGFERVRALVAQSPGPRPGRIRDPALERWLAGIVAELRRANERARLPFTPGEPRQPVDDVSSMYNDCALEIIDADLATGSAHLGSVKRAMILVDGDVSIPFIRDSIVIATGRVRSAFVDNSVVIAGGELRVSGGGRRFADGRGGIPNILLSGATVRGPSWGAVVGAPDGVDWQPRWGSVLVSSPAMQRVAPGASRTSSVILAHTVVSPLAGRYEAAVSRGERPRVCLYAAGEERELACGLQGQALRGELAGWRIAFSSDTLVTLARGEERLRVHPSRAPLGPSGGLSPPANAEVHAVGVYDSPLPYGNIRVRVHPRDAPVVLVLMSHEAVSWEVQAEGVELAGVVLAGYRLASVRGLPPGTPVVTRVHELGERAFRTHEADDPTVKASLHEVLGRAIAPRSFVGFEHAPPEVDLAAD